MSDTKYTPGPWYAFFVEANQRTHVGDWCFAQSPRGLPVPFRRCGGHNRQAAANAKLMAASPEMFEAMNDVVNAVGLTEEEVAKLVTGEEVTITLTTAEVQYLYAAYVKAGG